MKSAPGIDYVDISSGKHADGIIQGSPTINGELEEFITQSKKKLLPFQGPEQYIEAYDEFYQTILKKK